MNAEAMDSNVNKRVKIFLVRTDVDACLDTKSTQNYPSDALILMNA